jgi:hypothetical protein
VHDDKGVTALLQGVGLGGQLDDQVKLAGRRLVGQALHRPGADHEPAHPVAGRIALVEDVDPLHLRVVVEVAALALRQLGADLRLERLPAVPDEDAPRHLGVGEPRGVAGEAGLGGLEQDLPEEGALGLGGPDGAVVDRAGAVDRVGPDARPQVRRPAGEEVEREEGGDRRNDEAEDLDLVLGDPAGGGREGRAGGGPAPRSRVGRPPGQFRFFTILGAHRARFASRPAALDKSNFAF